MPWYDGTVRYDFYVGTPRLPNLDYVLSAETPTRRGLNGELLFVWGRDENFFEWSSADIVFLNAFATWRPTDQLRVEGRYQLQSYHGAVTVVRRHPAHSAPARRVPGGLAGVRAPDRGTGFELPGPAAPDDSRTNLPIRPRA
ncbi:MAG: hypothetical protein R2708_24765 [Vicinamibacterales bacterium]